MKIHNLRIGQRLGLSFGILVLLLVSIAVLTLLRIVTLSDEIKLINGDRYPKTVLVHDIKDQLNETARVTRNMMLVTDPAQLREEAENIANSSRIITAAMNRLDVIIKTEQGRRNMAAVHEARAAFLKARDAFLQARATNDLEKAKGVLFGSMRPAQMAYLGALDKLIVYQDMLMKTAGAESAASADQTLNFVLIIALSALAISAVVGWYATRSITRPLANAVAIARKVADGDLTSDIVIRSTDETGQLLTALRDMNSGLMRIVTQVRDGTEQIAAASSEIATGNLDLSSRTEQQAGSLEETASAMEQLTSAVRQNTANAMQANQLAQAASGIAAEGGGVVQQVIATMTAINESSKKIVDIIGVIDGIAFQTNILALNAAVEAARAGEQGRGFAVVASEVRNLAQRSATAAREIKHLIADSVEKVSSGAALVERAGSTMENVVGSVRRVSDVVGEITTAGREQNAGIAEINHAIAQMDHVTQQNAALVEEAAAAAASLQHQADDLSKLVSVFKLAETDTTAVALTAHHAAAAAPSQAGTTPSPLRTHRMPLPKILPSRPAMTLAASSGLRAARSVPKLPSRMQIAANGPEGGWERF